MIPNIAIIGVGGYGKVHLRHLLDFHKRGEASLTAAVALPVDRTASLTDELNSIGCRIHASLEELIDALPELAVDLAIVTTPIHLHADMSIALLQAGVHVLVEKPLTASREEAQRISHAIKSSGRQLSVGFQYLHAPEVRELHQLLYSGSIGRLEKISIHGAWPRSHSYYCRNNWAGRLELNGSPVLDSPINNAMSHFVMLALSLGSPPGQAPATPSSISAELYRIQRIDSFDTAVVKTKIRNGPDIEIYCTHSSERIAAPRLKIIGTKGRGEWIQDTFATLEGEADFNWRQEAHPEAHTRECMLRDVISKLKDPSSFACLPEIAVHHVGLVGNLHRHVPITLVPEDRTRQREQDGAIFTYLPGLDELLENASNSSKHLHELGADWAVAPITFSPTDLT
ncbi:Gfo/Idh/MocA family oxidoreductase [Pelagicoccus sp. NFK12]|uniref:Gfo/Idh/MocA family oxidoreductase n=1 Tax=Pelagicoccus enzymogenes TaxID=2773457 RepID=A0A927FDM2_9BACT|nr:Gfo/Idh/MocA family oxidoreductase [Pelagicoccus enzymogenes]MBD5782456.1 Gfo/Idh/MocA family oxidoreductase [Pelagicoccus enzymogenes]